MIKKILAAFAVACTAQLVSANVENITQAIQKAQPQLPISNIQATEVKNIYMGELDKRPIYLTEDAQYFFVGNLVRVSDLKNLSNDHQMKMQRIDWSALPLKDALKKVKGKGERKLVVFSDPNCPYCQTLEKELQKLDNVTIYTFVLAFKTQSVEPSKQLFCEKNPVQAWEDLILKKVQPSSKKTCANPVQRNLELAKKLGVSGTPTLVLQNGYKLVGAYSTEQLEAIWAENKL